MLQSLFDAWKWKEPQFQKMDTIIMRHLKWNFLAIYIQFYFLILFLCLIAVILRWIILQIPHVFIIFSSHLRLDCNKHLHFHFFFKLIIFLCFVTTWEFTKISFPVFIFNLIYMVIALGIKQNICTSASIEVKTVGKRVKITSRDYVKYIYV